MNKLAAQETSKPFLSPDEFFSAMSGAIGKNSLYKLIHSGKIKSIRVGRKILIPSSELMDFPGREAK